MVKQKQQQQLKKEFPIKPRWWLADLFFSSHIAKISWFIFRRLFSFIHNDTLWMNEWSNKLIQISILNLNDE